MSSDKKLITVFGATGNQGKSVVNSILASPELSKLFAIRGVTRDTSKPAAKELASRGVETVAADMGKADSLAAAVKGAYAVFLVTNYWESMSAEVEVGQGKAVTDASIAAGVKLLIWSGLPHVGKLTDGVLSHMHHFDSKADITTYIEQAKKGTSTAAVYVEPGFYMSNIKGMTNPSQQDGVPTLALPWNANDTLVPMFDAAKDTGAFVAAVLSATPESLDGKFVREVSEWLTPDTIVKTLSRVIGKEVRFAELQPSVFESFLPESMGKELTENMVLIRDYSYYGVKGKESEVEPANAKLVGQVQTTSWEQFVKENGPWEW